MRKFPKTVSRFMPYTKKLIEDRKDKLAFEKCKSKYSKPLRQWQSDLKLIIEGEVCDRSVYWHYDATGGAGKSFMSGLRSVDCCYSQRNISVLYQRQPHLVFYLYH
jgi:hypothetical protein